METLNKEFKSQLLQYKKELNEQQNLYAKNIKKLTEEININDNSSTEYIPEMIPPEQTYKIFFRIYYLTEFFTRKNVSYN